MGKTLRLPPAFSSPRKGAALLSNPAQAFIEKFPTTVPTFPFQETSSLSAAGINYRSLKAEEALKKL